MAPTLRPQSSKDAAKYSPPQPAAIYRHKHPMPDAAGYKREQLGEKAKVTSSILRAYMEWAQRRWPNAVDRLRPMVSADTAALLGKPLDENRRILFRQLIDVSKAIAVTEGGNPNVVYHDLGRHSAVVNMAGAYNRFSPEVPLQFFDHMDHLHHTFQNFGRSDYTRVGDRAGRIRLEGYPEFSPIYCQSGVGYYEQALRMLKAPGPIRVIEVGCQCLGEPACVYELSW
jgi:hypothetical protein